MKALDFKSYVELKGKVEAYITSNTQFDQFENDADAREHIRKSIYEYMKKENLQIAAYDHAQLYEALVIGLLDLDHFGPLESLLKDPDVTAIMVNSWNEIYYEKEGRLHEHDEHFEDNLHVLRLAHMIIAPLGRVLNESNPMVDARLSDGTRVNIVGRPIALSGPAITFQKFKSSPLSWDDLLKYGSLSPKVHDFLKYCVEAKLNICISGGISSGKTTLLNAISEFIRDDERVVTVENAAEIQLRNKHVVSLESRPPNIEGKGEITIADLVVNAMRMRPERIITGEVRSDEAWYMTQAMNLGHQGSMFTVHAGNPRDAMERLEEMSIVASTSTPISVIRSSLANAIDVIVQINRLSDGKRKLICITEVIGIQNNQIMMSDIFEFVQTGIDENGKIIGEFQTTGVKPRFLDRFEQAGIVLPDDFFTTRD